MHRQDTIAAIATPVGLGALGIIRVSGQEALAIVEGIFKNPRGKKIKDLKTYTAIYGHIVDKDEKIVDEVVILVMRGPHSFTGEDSLEISAHGGPLPLGQIMGLLLDRGVRLADPGEFSKRAFFNGRLDLVQAEAVHDIITAKTDKALSLALEQLKGSLSFLIKEMRLKLLELLTYMEASIDFPEDELEGYSFQEGLEVLKNVREQLMKTLATSSRGKVFRDGLKTAIIGRPNVGKSSLLNAFLGEERALVTEIPGTTRDFLEEVINLKGIPLRLIDTAGLRDTDDQIEKLGIDRTLAQLESSDLVLVVLDIQEGITRKDLEIISSVPSSKRIVVLNKTDLTDDISLLPLEELVPLEDIILISALENKGLEELASAIWQKITGPLESKEDILVTNIRHEKALELALEHVLKVQKQWSQLPVDILALDIREAIVSLGQITGETIEADITKNIFAKFCLGK